MTFIRGVFLFALVMLGAGIVGSKYIVSYLFGSTSGPTIKAIALMDSTPTPHPTRTGSKHRRAGSAVRHTATATSAAKPRPTATVHVLATSKPAATRVPATATTTPRHTPTATPTPALTPTPTATPLATPTSGVITLGRYWVSTTSASPGQTVAIGYVIENGTGQTQRIMLGASIKPDRTLNWAQGEIDDPAHDVVAVVPPGETLHTRYFSIPSSLKAGGYDVAWGLRNASTGARVALVAAPALTVR
jgi:hypothetical protein